MTLRQFKIAALAATFISAGTAVAYAQASIKAGGSASGSASVDGESISANTKTKAKGSATTGSGGASAGMSNSGDAKLKGLDRADEVAGTHGAQGRANARAKNKNY
jgi:hypothetical protein